MQHFMRVSFLKLIHGKAADIDIAARTQQRHASGLSKLSVMFIASLLDLESICTQIKDITPALICRARLITYILRSPAICEYWLTMHKLLS